MKYFEDIEIGDSWEFGEYDMKEEEILEFRKKYDPVPWQLDRKKAEDSYFKGIIASGLHTVGICTRMFILNLNLSLIASPGMEKIKWEEPVRPKDKISMKANVIDKSVPKSIPWGITKWKWNAFNQKEKKVMSAVISLFIEMRKEKN